ncbi:MAG: hypothetical protein ACRD3M_16460 [Thermoanaerobaculia bacterium]
MKKLISLFLLACLYGCASSKTTVRSYTDPTAGTRRLSAIAVLPMRNAAVAQAESIRMNREVAQTVQRQNPQLKVLGPVEAVQLLNQHNLVAEYDLYLTTLAQSGIPNAEIMRRIGQALQVDAIMQGQIVGLFQQDGAYGRNAGITKFTLRYSIVSTQDGLLLWETFGDVDERTATTVENAPALELVLPKATAIILKSIPRFAFAGGSS